MAAIVTLTMNPALDIATSTDRVEPTHKLRCARPRYDPGGGGENNLIELGDRELLDLVRLDLDRATKEA